MSTDRAKLIGGIVILLVGVGVIIIIALGGSPVRLWIAGASALGFVSGLTTGLSSQPGSGTEFVKFLGAGIVVPVLGGVAALLSRTQEVTEKSMYSGTQLVEKTSTTVTILSDGLLDPLAVLGSFFVVFGLFAVGGIISGVLLRKGGVPEVMAA